MFINFIEKIKKIKPNLSLEKVDTLILSLAINIILFALFFYFVTPRFQTPDDFIMMQIASGRLTGQPSEYLFYSNIIIGKLLVFLYSFLPHINWYPILLYFIHFISMIAIFCSLFSKKKNIYIISVYLLIFSVFELYFLTYLQWTTTAFVAGLGGIVLFLSFLESKGKSFYFANAVSIILITISGLIRENVFYLIIGLSIAILGLKFFKKPSWRIPVFLIIVLILFSSCIIFNKNYYQKDKEWAFYIEYHRFMAKVFNYPEFSYYYADNAERIYNKVGWSKNDLHIFNYGLYADPEIYSIEKLEYIVSNVKKGLSVKESFNTLKQSFIKLDIKIKWFSAFFLIIALVLKRKKNKYVLFSFFSALLISIYLSYKGRLPVHVFSPIFFFISLISLFFFFNSETNNRLIFLKKISVKIAVLIICVSLAALMFISISNQSKINKIWRSESEDVIERTNNGKNIYIYWSCTPGDATFTFLLPNIESTYRNIIYPWLIYSPFYNSILKKYSIDNIFKATVERDDIYLIVQESDKIDNLQDYIGAYKQFLHEHYYKSVTAVVVDKIYSSGVYVVIYKIKDNSLELN